MSDASSIVQRILKRYLDAARSGPGKAMLLATFLLSAMVFLHHDPVRALIAGSILYFFLITSLTLR